MNMQWSPALFSKEGKRRPSINFMLAALALGGALIFGGSGVLTRFNIGLVEILCLPALLWTILQLSQDGAWKAHRLPILILGGMAVLVCFQLAPLPPGLWAAWPGHEAAARGLSLAGAPIGWRPMSLSPLLTVSYGLALIPPAAVFLSILQMSQKETLWLTVMAVGSALLSIAIGGLQVAGSDDSWLYFYHPTNPGSAVGLFANRNHQAAMLVASLPFAALWVDLGRKNTRYKVPLIAAALSVFLIAIIGLVIVKSRAGVFLLLPALAASFFMIWKGGARTGSYRFVALIGASTLIVLLIAGVIGMGPLMERFENGADGRGATTEAVLSVANNYLPFGSGLGSFVPVYAAVEPIDTMGRSYWNHAHNDFAEVWLEGGILAGGLLLAFAAWWIMAAIRAWRAIVVQDTTPHQSPQAAIAAVATTSLLMIHSTVDYPLRTFALACVFALACGLMEQARAGPRAPT